jgi:hypothetical protein
MQKRIRMDPKPETARSLLDAALQQLQSAIALLDRAGAPGQIAAHVDLAANQLADAIEAADRSSRRLRPDDERRIAGATAWGQRPH